MAPDGFGDFAPTFFFGRSRVRRIVAGAGPACLLPTATNGVGAGRAPSITADWTARSGQRWVVPIGVMSGWSGRIRRQAIDWNVGVYRMDIRPTNTSIWQAALQFTLRYPKQRPHQAHAPHAAAGN